MISPNSFWLCLHELASAAKAEGYSDVERAANVLECFNEMPPMAKREMQEEFEELLSFLLNVRSDVLAPQTNHRTTPAAG
jgi:hypothetical protein